MKDKIQSKLAKAFDKKLSDAVHAFTCAKVIYSGEYDPVTETYPEQIDGSYSGRGVLFGSYKRDFVKPVDYQVEDAKATLLQNEVTAKPQIDDVWTTEKGDFKVVNVGADPTDSIYSIQLRKIVEP
ncbi:glutamate 5-kinase [Acinetobacter sp. SAAs470]|nr:MULTISPECIES: glutamate 5-kinase [unclassified Acinetobacter]WOE33100.1 glutamate 5-kinase [Acinetobacter sp. SAAs470]WOE39926.1 glutamate 5-kinase [Acinetobacter sp. SAAs474]